MIDLKKFVKKQVKVLPIVNKNGISNGRKIIHDVCDGWYLVEMASRTSIIRLASPLEVEKELQKKEIKKMRGYPLGQEIVPENFEIIKREGLQETVTVHFTAEEPFSFVSFAKWEDGNYYFYEKLLSPKMLQKIKERYDNKESLSDLSGATPEQRYYFLLCELQNGLLKTFEEIKNKYSLTEENEKKLRKKIKLQVGEHLSHAVIQAGGTYRRYQRIGNNFLIEWEIGGQVVKSVIKEDLRIINAGFCLSGNDQKHSLNSIVNLAKLFQRDHPLYITRD